MAGRVAHVQVVHGGAGFTAAGRVGADLDGGDRQPGLRLLGRLGADTGDGDDELLHHDSL